MQVLQYQVSTPQSTIAADVAQHYVPPPPYFASVGCNGQDASCRRRKYAWWCVGCGALAAALGGLLAAQHILVRAYTASPHHLETVPAAVPAAMLVLTGVCIMSLARRRNRYSYMIKVVGACCLMCALTCVLVTITTTVIHMNKLQTLKFCEYTKLTRTCTCFSMPPDSQHDNDDEGVRCVFEGVSECGVVHGALYWCLRGVFALSVSAVLVCIFSCMLAYQLLSHERKKMYWEQLELRCRSLYRPAATQAAGNSQPACGCCQCHPQPAWDISLQHRFWAPGEITDYLHHSNSWKLPACLRLQPEPSSVSLGVSPQHRALGSRSYRQLVLPNPGAGRKTSAWSWFPWPRSNSQNSRCRMGGVPQSGDSAYGFCDTDAANTGAQYDERAYHAQHAGPTFQAQANFTPTQANFQGPSFQQTNLPSGSFSQGYQEFPESSSYDAQTGVWGPPPPYSPQGRGGNRHPHIHAQDPAAATLLHRHHIDVHRTHTHETHTCTRSYIHDRDRNNDRNELVRSNADIVRANEIRGSADMARMGQEMIRGNSEMGRLNPEMARLNPEMARLNPEMARLNPEMARCNPEMARLNPEMARLNPEMARLNPEMARLNPEMARLNPEMGHMMYPSEEIEMGHMQDGRFNTLRGHLVPYRCQRLGMSASNLHSCRADENVTIECVHQKSISKVSDQSSDSCPPKQGKENLGFQNDKHSPIRSSMQDCGVNQLAESEVYFADVSSCCNVSVKADCCMNPTVSALVGTIENHPESTSESDTGSFTLTRQRPQPQGSKRRPRTDKHNSRQDKRVNTSGDRMVNSSLRLTEHQIEQLNLRMNERIVERMGDRIGSDRMNNERIGSERIGGDRMNNERIGSDRISGDRMNNERIGSDRILNERMGSDRICNERMSGDRNLNERMGSDRIGNERICNERMGSDRIVNERMGSDRIVNERIGSDRIVNERITGDRVANERIGSERTINERSDRMVNERMGSDRLATERIDRTDRNEMRMSERMNDSRDRLNERNDSRDRLNEREERINDSRISDRMNDSRISDRMNETRLSERLNDSRFERMNDSRISERLNDSRMDRLNESRLERMNDSRISDRMNESRISDRMNETRNSERMNERIRMNDSLNESRHSAIERMSDLNSSIRIEGSPKMRSHISPLRLPKTSPKIKENKDSKEFFIPAPVISPLSPNTEESLLSDDGQDQVYSNDPGGSKCLGPDSQYEVREEKGEILKGNHVHCYSDTNTMDSGWQSGSEKQVTD